MTGKHLIFAAVLVALIAPAFPKTKEEKEQSKAEKREKKEREETSSSKSKSEKSTKPSVPSGPPSPSEGYDGYKFVRGRNIFDPSRRGLRIETPGSSTASVPRGRSLALTGTMVTDGKSLAFFGGSAAEGSRVVSAGNSVAGYKVAEIGSAHVALEREGKTITLNVGRQMTFESGSAEPGVTPPGPVIEAAAPPVTETMGIPSLPGLSGDKAEILRRMMERRAKEMGK